MGTRGEFKVAITKEDLVFPTANDRLEVLEATLESIADQYDAADCQRSQRLTLTGHN